MSTIGLIGSGNMGHVLARAAIDADYEVIVSNSRGPESLKGMANALGPHARAATVGQVAAQSDLVVLVAPFDSLGFDAVDIGPLSAGRVITPLDAWERPLGLTEMSELMTSRLSASAA